MIEWLQNFSGLKTSDLNMERTELSNLRKEMAKYKKKYAKDDQEMAVSSDSDVLISFHFRLMMKSKIKSTPSSRREKTRWQEEDKEAV